MFKWLDFFKPKSEPENKLVFFNLPTAVHNAMKTYAYMEQIDLDETFEKACISFLQRKLFVKKDQPDAKFDEITKHHYIRQMK